MDEPIAIIGIGCRFPGGAGSPDQLWQLLLDGVEAIGPVPQDRWDADRFFTTDHRTPGRMTSRRAAFLDDVTGFDAGFFGMAARVAEQLDPQQRLLLEVCWEALEDAGLVPSSLAGTTAGVFVGACGQDYNHIQAEEPATIGAHTATGTYASILANRVSYLLDTHGPSMVLDTACSSSLVAVHQAVRSLRAGESDLALACGVNMLLAPTSGVALSQAGMLSPRGRSWAFDARADGYVRGEGSGVVVLKPLSRARADRDRIYALIAGTSVNQDGRTPGITVPSGPAQEANLRTALRAAGVAPGEVAFVEAHGTGTPVGDPIEATALGRVLAEGRERTAFLGSIKTNIGHQEGASGVAGLIKAALSVHHRRIVPNPNFEQPNPEIDFTRWHLAVPTSDLPWPDGYRRAAAVVNSFGFGGTNACAVVTADEPATDDPPADDQPTVLVLSAHTEQALTELATIHAERLETTDTDLPALGAALALRREHRRHRLSVAATDTPDAARRLRQFLDGAQRLGTVAGTSAERTNRVAFVFNGQGPQWYAMGRGLMRASATFRDVIDECDRLARADLGWSIREALGAPDEQSSPVHRTAVLQPTMFAVQVALAHLWRDWGVVPDGVVGHSMGEIAAAHVSGALDLATALSVIGRRAALQERARDDGAMLFVALPRAQALELCGDEVWLSAENGPSSCTLSGRRERLDALSARLDGVFHRMLRVNCACHSPDMEPLRAELLAALDGTHARTATTPLYSTVTGTRVDGAELSAGYWWDNFREPVRFHSAVQEMLLDGYDTFVELSPHPVLTGALSETAAQLGEPALVVSSVDRRQDDWDCFLDAVGRLWTAGVPIDWHARYPDGARAVSLPVTRWQHTSFWNESTVALHRRTGRQRHPMLARIDAPRPAWRIEWDDDRLSWVRDHHVFGSVLVPGVAYLEAALNAAGEVTGETCALEFVEFERACVLTPDAAVVTRVDLDPDQGTFEMHSRDLRGEDWTRNVRGRFHRGGLPGQVVDIDAIRARCVRVRSGREVSAALRRAGYAYGPTFTGLVELHLGHGESLAMIDRPAAIDTTVGYTVHPALLDACLQAAILRPRDPHSPDLIESKDLPVGVDTVIVHDGAGEPRWCHTRTVSTGPGGSVVDVLVFDAAGRTAVTMRGVRTRSVPTATRAADGFGYHLLEWVPDGPVFAAARAVTTDLTPLADTLPQPYPAGYQRELSALCADHVVDTLRRTGRPLTEGTVLDDFPEVVERYRPLLRRCLGYLVEDGVLTEEGTGYRVTATPVPDPGRPGRLVARYPQCVWELALLDATVAALPAVLSGSLDPAEVLFPGGETDLVLPIFDTSPATRSYHRLVREVVGQVFRDADPARTVRILEIGAGTGGLTAHVLPALPDGRYEYTFTDVSEQFLRTGRTRFGDRPGVRFAVADVESDLVAQGLPADRFDLVLASDVVHATTNVRDVLHRLRDVLAPDGVLVLVEAAPGNRWLNLTFGLTPGWWAFQGDPLRQDGPLMTEDAWRAVLTASGYTDALTLTGPTHIGPGTQAVLIARNPANPGAPAGRPETTDPAPAGSWLLVSSADELAARLADRMRGHGARVRELTPADEPADDVQPDAVVFFSACLDTTDAVRFAEHIGRECLALSRLLGTLDRRPMPARVSVVTRRAHGARGKEAHLAGAGMWGFCLSARAEFPRLDVSVIDVDDEDTLDVLWAELRRADREPETLVRLGERFVRRVVPFDPTVLPMVAAGDDPFVLATTAPGDLAELRYRPATRPTPGPGQVEIEIMATGLNFLDVMTALGQVPPLDGTDPRFGAECAGVVSRVGPATDFAVGDPVLAVSPRQGGIGSHLTLDARCVVAKPDAMSFEQAAVVPVAFVTAWHTLTHLARLRAGETVLVHSAAGGTGLAAVAVARRLGAQIVATAGSARKRDFLRAIGVPHVLDSRASGLAERVAELTGGRGVDVVLGASSGDTAEQGIACLAPYGRFVEIGKNDSRRDHRLGLRPFARNLSYFCFDLRQMAEDRPDVVRVDLTAVLAAFADGTLTPPPSRVFSCADVPDAMRRMSAPTHLGKIVIELDRAAVRVRPTPREVPLRGTWLITGGLGGFGLAMAEELAAAGVRDLVLLGRSGVRTAQDQDRIEDLTALGARVRVEAVDVTDEDALRRVVDGVRTTLRGVVHGAMVLDDMPIVDLDQRSLDTVLGPKVLGAWHLHTMTADIELDAFVLFSSAASAISGRGQANYAAANAFLDHLAHARQAQGLPALAINWGAIADAGYLTRNKEVARMIEARGIGSLTATRAFQALRALLATGRPQAAAMPMDWQRYLDYHAMTTDDQPRYATVHLGTATRPGQELPLRERLHGTEDRVDLLAEHLRTHLATVLGMPASEVDDDMPLADYLDSLLSVSIGAWIERELSIRLNVMEVIQGTTVRQLVIRLLAMLGD